MLITALYYFDEMYKMTPQVTLTYLKMTPQKPIKILKMTPKQNGRSHFIGNKLPAPKIDTCFCLVALVEVYITAITAVIGALNEKIRLLKKNIYFLRVVVGERHFACNFPCMNYPMYFNFWNLLISLPEEKQEKF